MGQADLWNRNRQRLPDLDTSDPVKLVLGLEPPEAEVVLEFAPEREWFYVCHQTAGLCTDHEFLYATALTFNPELQSAADRLARSWSRSNAGCARPDLDEVAFYRSQLQELFGVDCRHSYPKFQEAYYPIDPTPAAIRRLAVDSLPESLDSLLVSATQAGRTDWSPHAEHYSSGGWQLVILGENSD